MLLTLKLSCKMKSMFLEYKIAAKKKYVTPHFNKAICPIVLLFFRILPNPLCLFPLPFIFCYCPLTFLFTLTICRFSLEKISDLFSHFLQLHNSVSEHFNKFSRLSEWSSTASRLPATSQKNTIREKPRKEKTKDYVLEKIL